MIGRILHFYTAKAGQGATTATALAALNGHGERLVIDASREHDMPRAFGVNEPLEWSATPGWRIEVGPQLGLIRNCAAVETLMFMYDADTAYVDHGQLDRPISDTGWHDSRHRWLLVTTADYLALARHRGQRPPDGIVLIWEAGRALGTDDVEGAIGAPIVATINRDLSIARCLDAGLLATRTPKINLNLDRKENA